MLWENHFCLKLWLWNVLGKHPTVGIFLIMVMLAWDVHALRISDLNFDLKFFTFSKGCAWWTSSQSLATLTGDGQGSRMPCWKSGTSLNLKLEMLQRSWSTSRGVWCWKHLVQSNRPAIQMKMLRIEVQCVRLPGSQIWFPTRKISPYGTGGYYPCIKLPIVSLIMVKCYECIIVFNRHRNSMLWC